MERETGFARPLGGRSACDSVAANRRPATQRGFGARGVGCGGGGSILRVYAHALREEETDLSVFDFGGTKRLFPASGISGGDSESSNPLKRLARWEREL